MQLIVLNYWNHRNENDGENANIQHDSYNLNKLTAQN